MLSRVANSLYWLSRYLERAENLARMVDVNRYDALDTRSTDPLDPDDPAALWRPLLRATCLEESYAEACQGREPLPEVAWFITFSSDQVESIRECLAMARENARTVRDQISEEMWLELNSFHLFLQSQRAERLWRAQPEVFYRQVINFCLLFSGLINATILHDEGWHFIQAGKFLERADKSTRILDMLAFHRSLDRARLASALRSCSGFSAFQTEFRGDFNLENVVGFLLFSQSFPRSLRFCLRQVDTHLHAISGTTAGGYFNEAERLTGSLLARLNYSGVDTVWTTGHHAYLDELQGQLNEIGQQLFETYVLLPLEIRSLASQGGASWQQQQQQQ